MTVGYPLQVSGYVTQDKFLVGRPLTTLEHYLGFHGGRLGGGATFVRLDRLPLESEFELAAYSMTAQHRHSTPGGLDIAKLKQIAIGQWRLSGGDRLIKVLPGIAHNPAMTDDAQYPPGTGVPQWRIVGVRIPGTIVAEVASGETYMPRL
jgi:hypothetical protein